MRLTFALALAGVTALTSAPPLTAATVHTRLLDAKTVAIGVEVEGRFLTGSDAQRAVRWIADDAVLLAVRKAFEDWGRYEVVDRAIEADLFVAVRIGRTGAITIGSSAGGPTEAGRASARTVVAEAGWPDDALTVYDASQGAKRAFLWERRARHGLQGSEPALVRALREVVESARPGR